MTAIRLYREYGPLLSTEKESTKKGNVSKLGTFPFLFLLTCRIWIHPIDLLNLLLDPSPPFDQHINNLLPHIHRHLRHGDP